MELVSASEADPLDLVAGLASARLRLIPSALGTEADTLADTTESGCRGWASERPRLSPWDLELESLPSEADPSDFVAGLASVRLRLSP